MERIFIFACKKAILISVVYASLQKRLIEMNTRTPSIHISNGINESELDREKLKLKKHETMIKYNINYRDKTKFIVYCGKNSLYYKPELLLQPLKRLIEDGNDIIYIVVGSDAQVTKMAKNLGIDKNVFFLGYIPHKELLKLLLLANAAFYTLDDSFPDPDCALGTKVLEYISCKLPILSVANTDSAVSKIILEHKIGINLSWEKTDEIDKSLEEIINNRKYKANIEKFFPQFLNEYSRDRNNNRFYNKLINLYFESH